MVGSYLDVSYTKNCSLEAVVLKDRTMKERIYLLTLVLFFGFSQCGYCTVVTEVDWHPGSEPPSWSWIIWPMHPTADDIIGFAGPTAMEGNWCEATRHYGGWPTITIYHGNKTVELWFMPPAPDYCPAVVAPVCGLQGQFGPLDEGEWVFFGNVDIPDLPDPRRGGEGDIAFSIEFTVAAASLVELDDPNGGESFVAGSRHVVSWRDLRFEGICPSTYELQYSTDNGNNWITDMTIGGRCSALWTVPDVNSDECLVRVYDISEPDDGDQSDNVFTIYQCTESFAADYDVDCYVNGYDYSLFAWWWGFEMAEMSELAELASTWLECSNPYDPDCGD